MLKYKPLENKKTRNVYQAVNSSFGDKEILDVSNFSYDLNDQEVLAMSSQNQTINSNNCLKRPS